MSPRRHRRREDAPGTRPDPAGIGTVEAFRGADHAVRPVTGDRAVKTYRCPGCDQEIRPGVAHVVVWPLDGDPELDRRHWHRPCWAARERRGTGVTRSRNAPRYG